MTAPADVRAVAPAPGRRWLVLAAFMAVSAVSQLMWLAYAPIAADLQKLAGISVSQVVLLSTVFPILYLPLSIPVGRVIDRYGFRVSVLIGSLLTGLGALVRVFSADFGVLLLGAIIIAVGQPFILNSVTKLSANWFEDHERAKVNGLFTLSLFFGMILATGLTPVLFGAFGGTSTVNSLRDLALVYAVIALAAFALFAAVGRPNPARVDLEATATRAARDSSGGPSTWRSIKELWQVPGFALLLFATAAGMGSMIAFLQLIDEILHSKGQGGAAIGTLGSLCIIGAGIGAFGISALSDRLGQRGLVLAVSLLVAALGLLGLAAADGTVALAVAGVVIAATISASWPLSLTVSEIIAGGSVAGMSASVVLLVGNFAGVVLTFAMEGLYRTLGHGTSFTSAVMFLAVVCVLGVLPLLRIAAMPVPVHPASSQRSPSG